MNPRFATVVTMLLWVVPSAPLPGQSANSCAPLDTAAVRRWHATWDGVPLERLGEVAATHGREGAPTARLRPVDTTFGTTPLVVHWQITVVLANGFGPDLRWEGRLRFSPRSGSVDRSAGWLIGDSLIKAWWHVSADSMPIRAKLRPDGTFSIGLDPPADDGGALLVRALDSRGMYGTWWPAGSVLPPFMGWFCAVPVVLATESGWGP